MASRAKFSYHRLRNEGESDEAEEERAFRKIRKCSKLRKLTGRKRPKIRIPSLKRFLRRRARFFSKVKVSMVKALKRLKNGQTHLDELFGGTFLLMQVNPTPFKCGRETFYGSCPSWLAL